MTSEGQVFCAGGSEKGQGDRRHGDPGLALHSLSNQETLPGTERGAQDQTRWVRSMVSAFSENTASYHAGKHRAPRPHSPLGPQHTVDTQ